MWKAFTKFLVWQPTHIWAISAIFFVMFLAALAAKFRYSQLRCLPLFIISIVWLAYGFWERQAVISRWDIRVDLLFGWPLLFGGTLVAIVFSVQSLIRAVENNGKNKKNPR